MTGRSRQLDLVGYACTCALALACTEPEGSPSIGFSPNTGGTAGARPRHEAFMCPGVAGRTSRALVELEALESADAGQQLPGAGDAGASDAGPLGSPPACQGGRVVHFVYFVEADQRFSESQRAALERQAFVTQKYFYDLLGATFYLNDPVVDVIRGRREASWYVDTPDGIHDDSRFYRIGNIKDEVYATLGIDDFDPHHRVVNYPVARRDGSVAANFGGAWMDGDDITCIIDGGFNFEFDCNPVHCLGGMLHELGHVLGLEHTGPDDDCMVQGMFTNDLDDLCTFSDSNVAEVLANRDNAGWFEAQPGDLCNGVL